MTAAPPTPASSATEAKAVDHALCKQIALSVVNIGGDLLSAEGQRDLALCYLAYAAALSRDSGEVVRRLLDARPDWTTTLMRCEEAFQARPVWKWLDGKPAATDVPVIAATLIQTALHDFIVSQMAALSADLKERWAWTHAAYEAAEAEALRLRTALEHIAATVRTGEVDDQWCASMCDEALHLPGASKPEEGQCDFCGETWPTISGASHICTGKPR